MLSIIQRNRQGDGGFTLLEVMLTMFVFTIAVLVFASTVPVAAKTAYLNGQYAQAMFICQHKIDEMRQIGYGRLTYSELQVAGLIDTSKTTSPYSFTTAAADGLSTNDDLNNATGTIGVNNINLPITGTAAREVTVTLTWKPVKYSTRTTSLVLVTRITQSE